MSRRTSILIVLSVACVAFGAVALLVYTLSRHTASVSAETVAERSVESRAALTANLDADTTLHVIQIGYAPKDIPPQPFRLPDRYRSEYWAYFDSTGEVAILYAEVRDELTKTLVQTTELTGGELVITDVPTGTVRRRAGFQTSAADIQATTLDAQLDTASLIAPDDAAITAGINGVDAYLIEFTAGRDQSAVKRMYVDADSYRELKWEIVAADGAIVESRETPVFEISDGQVLPSELVP